MPLSSNSHSDLPSFSNAPGYASWSESSQGKETKVESWITAIGKSVKDSQYWVRMTHRKPNGYQSLFFKIPYDRKSTIINQKFRQETKNFECIYSENTASTLVESRYKPEGDFTVKLDEKTGKATIDFTCKFTKKSSGVCEIKGRCEWLGGLSELQMPGIFTWQEGSIQHTSTQAWLLRGKWPSDDWPPQEAWILTGHQNYITSETYRDWQIYLLSDSQDEPIHQKTFFHLDQKSHFHYYPRFGSGYEGEYGVTVTLDPATLQCQADFHHTIENVVKMTQGKFFTRRI